MPFLRIQTAAQQTADYLRAELARGRWHDGMPGSMKLAAEIGVGHNTVDAALRLLETEGLLASGGRRRRRHIQMPTGSLQQRPLRFGMLLHSPVDRQIGYVVNLAHELSEAGHSALIAPQTLMELNMDPERIGRLVRRTGADAWIVQSGSQAVLSWFAAQPAPAFAMFGRFENLSLAAAGPNGTPAFRMATRTLLAHGHRRIVCLCRRQWRQPEPASYMRAYLEELQAAGLTVSSYNLPDWEETNAGFQECLTALFRVTPPTALMVDEAPFLVAALQFMARARIRVPEDVSLVSFDDDVAFAGCDPPIACMKWDVQPLIRRVLRWASLLSQSTVDTKQTFVRVTFDPGGTIGRSPG